MDGWTRVQRQLFCTVEGEWEGESGTVTVLYSKYSSYRSCMGALNARTTRTGLLYSIGQREAFMYSIVNENF